MAKRLHGLGRNKLYGKEAMIRAQLLAEVKSTYRPLLLTPAQRKTIMARS